MAMKELFLDELMQHGGSPGYSAYAELSEEKNGLQRCLFVDLYVANPSSAKQAAKDAGYKSATACAALMRNQLVQAAIAEQMNKRIERTRITQDRILQELAIIGFSNLEHYTVDPETGFVEAISGMPEHVMRAISSVKFIVTIDEDGKETRRTEIKLWDKVAALHLAGKHLGMFVEKVSGSIDVNVKQKWQIGNVEIVF
jgi:phage terminase small subunit